MSKADKAALAKGAEAIREAEADARAGNGFKVTAKTKLDGTLAAATKRLIELHNQIQAGVRMTFEGAIEAGKILCSVRASRKGKWLKWLDDNVPFSQQTAWRYMWCYENRARLLTVSNLSEAYALLKDRPDKRKSRKPDPAVEELVSKGIAKDERDARRILREQETEEEEAPMPAETKPAGIESPVESPTGWTPSSLTKDDLTNEERTLLRALADKSILRAIRDLTDEDAESLRQLADRPQARFAAILHAACEGDLLAELRAELNEDQKAR